MGCDIHLYVERKLPTENENGYAQWEHVPGCRWHEDVEYIRQLKKDAELDNRKVDENYWKSSELGETTTCSAFWRTFVIRAMRLSRC